MTQTASGASAVAYGFLRGNAHAVQRLFRAKFPPGTENLLYERFCKPTPDFFPQCQDHGPDCREVSGLLREHEDAEKPGDRQAETGQSHQKKRRNYGDYKMYF